ncbi:unnamed protein product [Notodromas monacha]|uniref:Uncharacterized protein n=1 Tax=Notodromas monacha TaxID=399045 RepID=A0A7R9C039_9CRUS|nr:unnamed protein product [Notodromas monacha]CAG0924488.1 unnamed protein product [Notodromas monacha]
MNANEALLYNDFQNDEEESLDRFSVSVDQEDNARLEADSDESDVDAKVDRKEAMADAASTSLKSSDSRNELKARYLTQMCSQKWYHADPEVDADVGLENLQPQNQEGADIMMTQPMMMMESL